MEWVSPAKELDRQARVSMLEGMEIAIRTGDMETAKSLGESARKMKEQIETKDYTIDDAVLERCKIIETNWNV